MKIAKYKCLEHGFITYDIDDELEDLAGFIRLTEFAEVEFVDLPTEETVPKEVEALEKAKNEARIKFQGVINDIDEKISKLLAITQETDQ